MGFSVPCPHWEREDGAVTMPRNQSAGLGSKQRCVAVWDDRIIDTRTKEEAIEVKGDDGDSDAKSGSVTAPERRPSTERVAHQGCPFGDEAGHDIRQWVLAPCQGLITAECVELGVIGDRKLGTTG